MHTLTVIGRDNGNIGYENVLIYAVAVKKCDHDTVLAAYIAERENDMGEMDDTEKENIEILFAFAGEINTAKDWRT